MKTILRLALPFVLLPTLALAVYAPIPEQEQGKALTYRLGASVYHDSNIFGAATGAFFLGAGYASIYPLVAEAIGRRFPYYHPGFFNGIFSLALVGGLLAPASVGYAAAGMGVGVVIGIPLAGTCMVMVLVLLIWLESKVTGR